MAQIGDIAEQVLEEVRSANLTKIAEHEVIQAEGRKPRPKTALGAALLKCAEDLRSMNEDITVEELQGFLGRVQNAVSSS